MNNFSDRFNQVIESLGKSKRSAQTQMADAVFEAIEESRHLLVEAGTGTGKSMAYLVPAILSGKKVVISTATKELQDQLIKKDIVDAYKGLNLTNRAEVLKGRGNYLCLKKLSEINIEENNFNDKQFSEIFSEDDVSVDGLVSLGLERSLGSKKLSSSSVKASPSIREILHWSLNTVTGDIEESGISLRGYELSAVVSTSSECPGAKNCSLSSKCYAEMAKRRAQEASIVVVNHSLYAQHIKSKNGVLPEHDVVIFDEAHDLEDILFKSLGTEISLTSISSLLTSARKTAKLLSIDNRVEQILGTEFNSRIVMFRDILAENQGKRIKHPLDHNLVDSLAGIKESLSLLKAVIANTDVTLGVQESFLFSDETISTKEVKDISKEQIVKNQKLSTLNLIDYFLEAADSVLNSSKFDAIWVDKRGEKNFVLNLAQTDISKYLSENLFGDVTAILTSATLSGRLKYSLGLADYNPTELRLESPFDYESSSMIYCPVDLDVNYSNSKLQIQAKIPIIKSLINASKGRCLLLCTSHSAVTEIFEKLEFQIDFSLYRQDQYPKQVLLDKFRNEVDSCLVATQSFWQGVDIPGAALTLVIIDKIPFPQINDPFLEARRERSENGFMDIDLPYATKLLAQGVGRLIRLDSDIGAVAILDSRLVTKSYGKMLIQSLPPMRFTSSMNEITEFLNRL